MNGYPQDRSKQNKSSIQQNYNLYNKIECPVCKYVFIMGFVIDPIQKCPSCKNPISTDKKIYPSANNVYYKDGCPAIMSDSRFLTNYQSTNDLTDKMMKANGYHNANQFRRFLQNNAEILMDAERDYIETENKCKPKNECSMGWRNFKANNDSW